MKHRIVPLNAPWFTDAETESVLAALKSGWVTTGEATHRLERDFAAYCGRAYGVACSSGTAALWLAIKALGIGPGDRVLSQSCTCDAVVNAAGFATHAPPLLVDVEPDTWGIATDQVGRALDEHPEIRAVVIAHMYGVPSRDTEGVVNVCKQRGVWCIEDASEAHGARLGERMIGSFGDVSVFSFRGEKVLSGGQLGIVLTDDEDVARRAHQFAHCGLPADSVRFWATEFAFNCQPANLNAALALAQLGRLDELVKARRGVHARWRELFANAPGVAFQWSHGEPVWWLTAITYTREFSAILPQDLMAGLAEYGVQSRSGFYPLSFYPHCDGQAVTPCPVSERLLRQGLILPSGPTLTPADQAYVVACIQRITGRTW